MVNLEANNLSKQYGAEDAAVHAVRDISLTVAAGEFLAIMGESGSGKSTLLSMLGGLNTPTSGAFTVDEFNVAELDIDQRADFRREFMGFVFQSFHLVPYLTVVENVMLPLATTDLSRREKLELARAALEKVSLGGKGDRLPNQISGGEAERVAIARAIVNEPPVLMADEPTGNLDSATSGEIMRLIQDLNDQGMTIIMVTHSHECAAYADRLVRIADGRIIEDSGSEKTSDTVNL
jgi:putative ABC transport system ATP-binding protein